MAHPGQGDCSDVKPGPIRINSPCQIRWQCPLALALGLLASDAWCSWQWQLVWGESSQALRSPFPFHSPLRTTHPDPPTSPGTSNESSHHKTSEFPFLAGPRPLSTPSSWAVHPRPDTCWLGVRRPLSDRARLQRSSILQGWGGRPSLEHDLRSPADTTEAHLPLGTPFGQTLCLVKIRYGSNILYSC